MEQNRTIGILSRSGFLLNNVTGWSVQNPQGTGRTKYCDSQTVYFNFMMLFALYWFPSYLSEFSDRLSWLELESDQQGPWSVLCNLLRQRAVY